MRSGYRRIIVLVLALLVYIISSKAVGAAAKKGIVSTDGLNVRVGAGTTHDILKQDGNYVKLSRGTSVTIKDEAAGGWYHITAKYNSKTVEGYVAAMYVNIVVDKSILAEYTNIGGKLISKKPIHTKGSAKSAYVKYDGKKINLKAGTKVTITGVKKVSGKFWYIVRFTYKKKEYTGYIDSAYVKLTEKKVASYIYKKSAV